MKVFQLSNRLKESDLDDGVLLQTDRKMFASPAWLGILDTAGLFAEEKEFRLVISAWEPEDSLKPAPADRGCKS